VLLVLDDMSSSGDQVEALLHRQYLRPDSCVIVTSRQRDYLRQHCGVNDTLLVKRVGLSLEDATTLFVKHAEPNGSVDVDMQRKIVEACDGLPLTLKVMNIQDGETHCSCEQTMQALHKNFQTGIHCRSLACI
jgi:hypothetical protein